MFGHETGTTFKETCAKPMEPLKLLGNLAFPPWHCGGYLKDANARLMLRHHQATSR
jgi:hypothetical protein